MPAPAAAPFGRSDSETPGAFSDRAISPGVAVCDDAATFAVGIAPRWRSMRLIEIVLGSGRAGVLVFTSGAPSSVIGVMVAVALLPPLVTAGMLAGAGQFGKAGGAFSLFLINVICVNLSGTLTLVAQGVRPWRWAEAKRGRRRSLVAIAGWTLLPAAIMGLLFVVRWRAL